MKSCEFVQRDSFVRYSLLSFVFIAWTAFDLSAAEPWPAFRGPRSDGVSRETVPFPLQWSPTENIAWATALPGAGHSSPVIWGDRIFVTSCIEKTGERLLICLNRAGKVEWQKSVLQAKLERKHKLNSYASSTPVTDGRHLWLTFLDQPHIRVACFDVAGNQVWQVSPGRFNSPHGFCSSPILYQNLVIVNCDQDDQEAFLVAFDKGTGKEVWRTDRPNRTRSYCVPLIVEAAGKTQMVLTGSKCTASYDPATGKQYWIIQGPTEQFVASVVYADDVFMVTGGFPEHHILGVRPDGQGDVTSTHILWRTTKATSYVPSPVAYQGLFFIVSDEGIGSCFDPKSGQRFWSERIGKHQSASLVAAGGYVYVLDDSGTTYVLRAGKKFDIVAKNELKEACYATPALSEGRIYIRTASRLVCIAAP